MAIVCTADGVAVGAASATADDLLLVLLDTEIQDIVVVAVTVTTVLRRSQGLIRSSVRVVTIVRRSESWNRCRVTRSWTSNRQQFLAIVVR